MRYSENFQGLFSCQTQAINGDLFEVCGPESDDFCRHGWFLDEEEAVKFALEEYPDFKYKDEDFRTIYELKTA